MTIKKKEENAQIEPEVIPEIIEDLEMTNNKAFGDETKKLLNDFVNTIKGKTDAQIKEVKDYVAKEFIRIQDKQRETAKNSIPSLDFKNIAKEVIAKSWESAKAQGGLIEKAVQDFSDVLPDGWLDLLVQSPDNYGFFVASLFQDETSTGRNFYIPTLDINNIPLDEASPGFVVELKKKNALTVNYDAEIEIKEDDLQDTISSISAQIAQIGNYITSGQFENSIISGDDTATHMDSNVTTGTDYRHRFKGLRKLALINADTQLDMAGSVNYEKLLGIRKRLLASGLNPAQLGYIFDIYSYLDSLAVMTDARTIEKFGNRAIIVNGVLEAIAGTPVIVSSAIPLTDADGFIKSTAGLNIKHNILCVNRDGFRTATRMALSLRVEQSGWNNKFYYRVRKGFAPLFPTKKMVAIGRNL